MYLRIRPLHTNINQTHEYLRVFTADIVLQNKKDRCCITGSRKNLTVHHSHRYRTLVKKAFERAGVPYRVLIADVTLEDRDKVIKELIELHKQISYYTVTYDVHKDYHDRYEVVTEQTWQQYVQMRKRANKRSRHQKSMNKNRR